MNDKIKFTKETIEIRVLEDSHSNVWKMEPIQAYVAGDYAIHGDRPYLNVTHVPTGTHVILLKALLRDMKELVTELIETGVTIKAELHTDKNGNDYFVVRNLPEEQKLLTNVIMKWRRFNR